MNELEHLLEVHRREHARAESLLGGAIAVLVVIVWALVECLS